MSATPSPTSATSELSQPSQYRPVGIVLAVGSGLLIGSSFVLKKKGLLRSQAGHEAGEGVAYLKSYMWWAGMIMMICGEICNFGAYAFVEAILVTPLGALSVVICAILSHFILKEKLTLFGWIGCIQCILGSVIIALNGPREQSVSTIVAFKKLFLAPWFLAFGGVCIAVTLGILFFVAPKFGKTNMLCYIAVCSLIGGLSVSCTQALGACIVTSIRGDNQFRNWFTYFLLVFVTTTLLTEIYYLNVALALFNTAMVTPTYYVLFTFCTLVTSTILYQGFKASASQIITIVLGFLVICTGIFILQMSRIDPRKLTKVDRKTTMLLQAAREEIKPEGGSDGDTTDVEKSIEATEEPGMDAVAGRFGGVGGSVVRARRRATIAGTRRQGRRRSGTNASGASAFTTNSIGMDSIRAKELHSKWLDEKKMSAESGEKEKDGRSGANGGEGEGEGSTSEMTHVGNWNPISISASIRTLPDAHDSSHVLSDERLTTSPTASPKMDLKRTPSVRFQDQEMLTAPNAVHDSYAHRRSTSIPDISHQMRPPVPPIPSCFLSASSYSTSSNSIDGVLASDKPGHSRSQSQDTSSGRGAGAGTVAAQGREDALTRPRTAS